MLGPVARISQRAVRNYVLKNNVRNGSHGGVPGENLPFDINNTRKFTGYFFVFILSGVASPFLILWHQLNKKL